MPVPTFDKNKLKKNRQKRTLLIVLSVLAASVLGLVFYFLHKLGPLSTIFNAGNPGAPTETPITPAPGNGKHGSVAYSDWNPFIFHDKLIYCDSNYKCRVKSDIAAAQLVSADLFSDGLARITLKTKDGESIVYLNKSGKIEVAANSSLETSGPFSEGLAYAVDKESGKLGFIDKHGKLVIPPRYYLGNSAAANAVKEENQLENCFFSSGLAPVYTDKVNAVGALTPSCGYIDHKGKWAIQPLFLEGCAFVGERARICAKDDSRSQRRWGYIDTHGARVISPVYMEAQNFSDDLGAVLDYQGKWGFVDKKGKFVIPAKYSDASSFSEGFAAVAQTTDKKRWGYIRKDDSWLIQPRFDSAGNFRGGEAKASNGDAASKNQEDYWINTEGKIDRHRRQLIPFDIEGLPLQSN